MGVKISVWALMGPWAALIVFAINVMAVMASGLTVVTVMTMTRLVVIKSVDLQASSFLCPSFYGVQSRQRIEVNQLIKTKGQPLSQVINRPGNQ